MPKKSPDYPCCLVLPYRVTVHFDGYSNDEPYMTDSGRVYIEMTTRQLAILEEGGAEYEETREFVTQYAKKGLKHDMTRAIERHEGIPNPDSWAYPLSPRHSMFVMLDSIDVVLQGTSVEWKQRKGGIYFEANVNFCVTGEM